MVQNINEAINLEFIVDLSADKQAEYEAANKTKQEAIEAYVGSAFVLGRPITQYFNPKTWNEYGYNDYIGVATYEAALEIDKEAQVYIPM